LIHYLWHQSFRLEVHFFLNRMLLLLILLLLLCETDLDGSTFSLAFVLFSPPIQFSFESITISNPGSVDIRVSSEQINIVGSPNSISTSDMENILRSVVYATNRTT